MHPQKFPRLPPAPTADDAAGAIVEKFQRGQTERERESEREREVLRY